MKTAYEIADKHGMMSRGEVDLLKSCLQSLPANPIVVNIGAGFGTSIVATFEARPDAFVFSVDKDETLKELQILHDARIAPSRCVRIVGLSWDVGANFPYEVDAVFVDGSHEESSVRKDILSWIPKISIGGHAYFHDYDHKKAPGVTIAVNELMDGQKVLGANRYLIAFEILRRV